MYDQPLALRDVETNGKGTALAQHADPTSQPRIEPAAQQQAGYRVAVPLDESRSSVEAIDFLVRSAHEMPAFEVHLVNVQPLIMRGDYALQNEAFLTERRARLQSIRKVLDAARAALEKGAIPCQTAVLFGDTAKAITAYAKQHGVDVIVMATRGMGTLRGLLLGSVATKVVSLADVPVTLVKPAQAVRV